MWVGCEKFIHQYIARYSHNQNQLTGERLVQKKIDLGAQFRRIYTLQFMNLHPSTPQYTEQTEPAPLPHTHLGPIQKKAKRRRRRDAILARDRRAHPDAQSTLTNATCCPSAFAFARACSSNTGSIILHGGHVADVNTATTARCAPSRLRNDAGFVDGWMAALVVGLLPRVLVEGAGVP